MFTEDDLVPLSGLQHLLFCERRAALVYLEGLWEENLFTAEGRLLHERADVYTCEVRGDRRIARALPIRSLRLGLSGKADVVEFHRVGGETPPPLLTAPDPTPVGVALPGLSGRWRLFPVEYKRGRLRHEEGYEVQLCAQALCLEEMLNTHVPAGAVFYGKTQRRLNIVFDQQLREQTERAAARLHELIAAGTTPAPLRSRRCRDCSLEPQCLPEAIATRRSTLGYLNEALSDVERGLP